MGSKGHTCLYRPESFPDDADCLQYPELSQETLKNLRRLKLTNASYNLNWVPAIIMLLLAELSEVYAYEDKVRRAA